MRRSRILDGREQQRSRAKLRKRLDKPPPDTDTVEEAIDQLQSRLGDEYPKGLSILRLERLDLDDYLGLTADLALSSAERLRQLAVHLEQSAGGIQPRGWLALERIYVLAQSLCDNPDERWEVLRSRAISASHFASSLGDDIEMEVRARHRLFRDAYAAALQLQEIDPACAGSYSLLAQIRYQDPEGDVLDALADTERALERDPEHFWAKWLRAACLRDLGMWSEAVDAYAAIDPADFSRRRAWRYEVLLESRAYCQLRAGNRAAAVREFEALLDRFERDPHLAANAWWHDLVEAARGRLKAELGERTRKLLARHADWLLPELDEGYLDDPGFLALVERLLAGAVASEQPDYLVVVQIDHWFGQKWRGFVGKVLGIAGARRTREFVVPPFHPNRVVREWQLVRGPDGDFFIDPDRGPVHIHQASSENWGRRIHRERAPSLWLWFSGESRKSGRASVMVYSVRGEGDEEASYIEYTYRDRAWEISKLAGVARQRVEQLVRSEAPVPLSLTRRDAS